MPQLTQTTLLNADSTNGTKAAFDIRNITAYSIFVKAVGGTSASIQVEGTADPSGQLGFAPLAMRQAGGGAYATTAESVSAGAGKSLYFDPSDNVAWIRVVVSAQTGPTALTVTLSGEE